MRDASPKPKCRRGDDEVLERVVAADFTGRDERADIELDPRPERIAIADPAVEPRREPVTGPR